LRQRYSKNERAKDEAEEKEERIKEAEDRRAAQIGAILWR
jgi:hypothetical protein